MGKHSFESVRRNAKSCSSVNEFKKKFNADWNWAQRNNILKEVQEGLKYGNNWGKNLSNEEIIEKALAFNTRYSFRKAYRVHYEEARKRSIIEEACSHMKYGAKGNVKKRVEDQILLQKALKYEYRSEMMKLDGGAYRSILSRGELRKKAFSHMKTLKLQPEFEFRENLIKKLNKISSLLNIKKEVCIGDSCRIDLIIEYNHNKIFVELKSELSKTYWTRKEIEIQIRKYNKILGSKGKVVLVSEFGGFGMSEENFIDYIIKFIS